MNLVNIGTSFNGGLLINNSNENNGPQNFKVNSYLVQPRIYAELGLESIKIHTAIGIGYTFMIFDASGTNNGFDVSDADQTESGLNLNLGIAYDITSSLFVQVQYDYIKSMLSMEYLI